MEAWVAGEFTSDTVDATAQQNAKAIGEAKAYDAIIEFLTEGDAANEERIGDLPNG